MTALPGWRERDAAVFLHQHGSTPALGVLRAASGVWLEDEAGRRVIDLHGNTVHHIGHGHPRLIAAIKDQLDRLAFAPRRYSNDVAITLGEKLTSRFRGGGSPGCCWPRAALTRLRSR